MEAISGLSQLEDKKQHEDVSKATQDEMRREKPETASSKKEQRRSGWYLPKTQLSKCQTGAHSSRMISSFLFQVFLLLQFLSSSQSLIPIIPLVSEYLLSHFSCRPAVQHLIKLCSHFFSTFLLCVLSPPELLAPGRQRQCFRFFFSILISDY